MKYCEANDCEAILTRAKYCKKHYLANRRHGNPNIKTKKYKNEWKGIECKVNDCQRPVSCMHLCSMHYQRDLRIKLYGLPRIKKCFNVTQ